MYEKIILKKTELHNLQPSFFKKNQCVAIVGNNGIGKSTWFQDIVKNSKWINYFGKPYFVSQNWTVPDLPVWHLVEMMYSLKSTNNLNNNINFHLKNWNLEEQEYQSLQTLSGGELQRLRLSFLDLPQTRDCPWLLLDEPFVNLDETHQLMFLNYLYKKKLGKLGIHLSTSSTIFFITHDVDFILKSMPELIDIIIEIQ